MQSDGAAAAAQVRRELDAARALAARMEALIYEPFILLEESRLARLSGDGAARRDLRARAYAGFRDCGATGYARLTAPE